MRYCAERPVCVHQADALPQQNSPQQREAAKQCRWRCLHGTMTEQSSRGCSKSDRVISGADARAIAGAQVPICKSRLSLMIVKCHDYRSDRSLGSENQGCKGSNALVRVCANVIHTFRPHAGLPRPDRTGLSQPGTRDASS